MFSLLADVHSWPRWGPFTDTTTPHLDRPGLPHPIRLGRHQLRVALTSPDAPYWLRYRLTDGPARAMHTAEVTLSPTDDDGTDLQWRVTEVAAQLASAAEDPATTRLEWATGRQPGSVAARRVFPAASRAGNDLAA